MRALSQLNLRGDKRPQTKSGSLIQTSALDRRGHPVTVRACGRIGLAMKQCLALGVRLCPRHRPAYHQAMDPQRAPLDSGDAEQHDLSLVRWMLTLTPMQRLAELESRIAFFHAARRQVA